MHKFHKISSRSLLGRGGCSLSEYDPLYEYATVPRTQCILHPKPKIGQLLYDLPLIGKVLAYAAAAAGQVKV